MSAGVHEVNNEHGPFDRRKELLEGLRLLGPDFPQDPEHSHLESEKLLLAYIDDEGVSEAFWAVPAWYA